MGTGAELALGLVLVSMLAVITVTDLKRRIIPNRVLAVAALLAATIVAVADPVSMPGRAAAAVGAGGVLLLAALANPGGMGMGDVKLAATMGLFLDAAVVPALVSALLLGSTVGVALMVRHGAAARKRAIPFGPFLALGGIAGLMTGPAPVDWYIRALT
jgi:prepilin signal peptidase PulO-like enzyme (type II secretory pathway)